MTRIRRIAGWLVGSSIALTLAFVAWATLHGRPQDLPWTPIDLGEPIGLFTGRKLAALTDAYPRCRALLDRAGVRFTPLAAHHEGQCGYDDGVRFAEGGARRIGYAPAGLGIACPVAAALAMWEWDVVQPAARRRFGARVVTIDHFGSYNCRRMYGRKTGGWSEHSTANAVDIAGFRLSDGRRITVARDWQTPNRESKNPKRLGDAAAFLRDVRDGACRLFATTLSPDYNAAHADHFHLDQARRGAMGRRACR